MSDPLQDFVNDLQDQINQETREEYGELFFERWRDPKFYGRMENPTSFAVITGDCGDTMEIYLQIKEDKIIKASFFTTGCGPSIVCGSLACDLALGKDLEQAALIEGDDILQLLKKVPPDKEHCAYLACQTLREAISHYWSKK